MTELEQKKAAIEFTDFWKDKGYEKGESQPFWLSLLGSVFGIEYPEQFIKFENQVHIDHTSFIDGMISATHVLIEQKGVDKNLRAPILQSDGSRLTPFQQAKRYSAELPYSERPRWIITCNFKEFLVYDMEKPTGEPESILLKDLPNELYRLKFIVNTGSELLKKEMEISLKAGEIVGELYNEILAQYDNPESESTLKSLNMLCVRLVFCLYAEDSGLFGEHLKFHNYVKAVADKDIEDVREALIKLFNVLNTPIERRDKYMKKDLASFPYVNGGLFAEEDIEIPNVNERIVNLLLKNASEDFDWKDISPTIFGAVFESTLNPETRRSGGMHYTSIENIHKVIDPLFLDDLKAELQEIKSIQVDRTRNKRLEDYRDKLASLNFLDPACGSGNFLTETYLSLRRLENEALKLQQGGQIQIETGGIIKVSIGQFYGIEINDFAVTVAKTALWIAESQMMKETEEIVHIALDFLPLKSYTNITEGNALRLNWEDIVNKDKLSYIMGNPPFVGYSLQTKKQKEDLGLIFQNWKNAGTLDYVACWYKKCFDLINGTSIRCALVSTNSVSQGESVANLWKPLFENGIHIDFVHRTFRWDSEASIKAHVHCVIIGFSVAPNNKQKIIYSSERQQVVENINGYLINADNIFVESRKKAICNVPAIVKGSIPVDNGNFLLNEQEYKTFQEKEPNALKYIKKYYGAREFLHNESRWCLWLKNITPLELRRMPLVYERVNNVREFRLNSTKEATRKFAEFPNRFMEIRQPENDYILIPSHSSEKRKYIPIGFVSKDIICSNANLMIPDATLYEFGVLISNVHNAWVRTICGRIKSDYRYSNDIVYNNFPWCTPTAEQKTKIEQTAQAILDARALYPDCSLADLYDELTMPSELRKAHQANDKAVMQAYGFWGKLNTESECVAELMKMYKDLTK